jgi:hypothetical protein
MTAFFSAKKRQKKPASKRMVLRLRERDRKANGGAKNQ